MNLCLPQLFPLSLVTIAAPFWGMHALFASHLFLKIFKQVLILGLEATHFGIRFTIEQDLLW